MKGTGYSSFGRKLAFLYCPVCQHTIFVSEIQTHLSIRHKIMLTDADAQGIKSESDLATVVTMIAMGRLSEEPRERNPDTAKLFQFWRDDVREEAAAGWLKALEKP
jgi:hypothetical protein